MILVKLDIVGVSSLNLHAKPRLTWKGGMMYKSRLLISLICVLALSIILNGADCKKWPWNNPPNTAEIPTGPTDGKQGDYLEFTSSSVDPDGDKVRIRFNWGDGEISDWSDLVDGGDLVKMTHIWYITSPTALHEYFEVKAQAKDEYGNASGWSDSYWIVILR